MKNVLLFFATFVTTAFAADTPIGSGSDDTSDFESKLTYVDGLAPGVDLRQLYQKLVDLPAEDQGHLSPVRGAPVFRQLQRGSHSHSVMGVGHEDGALEYVFKHIRTGASDYGMSETHKLVSLIDSPIFTKWNAEQRALGPDTMKLIVSLPLKMCCVQEGDSKNYVVVVEPAAGDHFHRFKENEALMGAFGEKLEELHYDTRRCHGDLNFNNILYDDSSKTITLIDVVGLAEKIPTDKELDYMIGEPMTGLDWMSGDVENVCLKMNFYYWEAQHIAFKLSYARAMIRKDPEMGRQVLARFKDEWVETDDFLQVPISNPYVE